MKLLVVIALFIIFAFIGWQLWYVFLVNIKEPSYKILKKKDGYEIRRYDSYIVAQISFPGSYKVVTNKGFKVLANYIFGENMQNVRMPMTAPVLIEEKAEINGYAIGFVMPSSYKKETIPKPKDSRIKIEKKFSEKVAAYSFSWYPSLKRIEQKRKEFVALLNRDGIKFGSSIFLARYNPPFVLPFLMRNELLVVINP